MMFMHSISLPIGLIGTLILVLAIAGGGYVLTRTVLRLGSRQSNRGTGSRVSQLPDDRIESRIYRMAKEHGGRLTVSDVVVATGLTPKESEKTLNELTDGSRVSMEVTDRGTVVYEFLELIPQEPEHTLLEKKDEA